MIDQIIDDVIQREGAKDTDNPNDSGGRTKFGISQKWDPQAWVNGPPTREQAVAIYKFKYIVSVGLDKVQPTYLQEQLIDFGVNSGPQTAVMHLQKILGLIADGQVGPSTLATLSKRDPVVVNNQLVDERVLMLARIVQKQPKDLEFLFGWITRALSFRK